MSFESPFLDPSTWDFDVVEITVPRGFRYAGYSARALRATTQGAAAVQAPSDAVVRVAALPQAEVLELEVLPFLERGTLLELPWGLPTFYLFFTSGTSLGVVEHDAVSQGEDLTSGPGVTEVTLAALFPDRMVREPLLWVEALGTGGAWQTFSDRVAAETGGGDDRAVLILDHAGRPVSSGSFELEIGGQIHTVDLQAQDQGDLQKAVARLNAGGQSIPFLFSQPGVPLIRPLPASTDIQMVRLEDLHTAVGQIEVEPGLRHVSFTDLGAWLAPQGVNDPTVPLSLRRFLRGNKVTPLINGTEFFADLFGALNQAAFTGGGVHLGAGYALVHREPMTRKPENDPDFANTFLGVVERIRAAGGQSRILAPDFIQVADIQELSSEEALVFFSLVDLAVILNMLSTRFSFLKDFRTDGSGLIIMALILLFDSHIINFLLSDGATKLEPAGEAVEDLDALSSVRCIYSSLPATIEDNPLAAAEGDFPFGTIFDWIRQFGLYHQKLGVVWTPDGPVGYCGGMDINTDRLDDERHLASYPFHDIHARLEGPSVRDLAITFQQRWERDAGDQDLVEVWQAGQPEPVIPDAGEDIVQIARTYFAPSDPARALEFAPQGDRTILDTMLRAIDQAREYIHIEDQYLSPPEELIQALENKVASGTVAKVIITTASENGQLFGGLVTDDLVARLRAADTSGEVVRVGLMRRRYTVPANGLRASSGRLILMQDLAASTGPNSVVHLGPAQRVPAPPFWLAVEGELMYVYDEAVPMTPPEPGVKAMSVERGAGTHLLSSHLGDFGPEVREHKKHAAATVISLDGIYVHAKPLLVDDVLGSIGSANLNRRGVYHDGECNLITIPEKLRKAPSNPVRYLRKRLWAEMLDLPWETVEPLLDDPLAASRLFDRSWLLGNTWVPIDTTPSHLMFGSFTGGDGWVMNVLTAAGFAVTATDQTHRAMFDSIVDPTSSLDPLLP